MGQLYLSNVDFLKCGVPASIIAALVWTSTLIPLPTNGHGIVYAQVVSTVGYLLMNLIG